MGKLTKAAAQTILTTVQTGPRGHLWRTLSVRPDPNDPKQAAFQVIGTRQLQVNGQVITLTDIIAH